MKKNQRGYIDWASILVIAFFSAIIIGLPAGLMLMDRYQCHNRAEEMGLESRWGIVMGCRVKVMDRYVPMDMIRITETGEIIVTGNEGD